MIDPQELMLENWITRIKTRSQPKPVKVISLSREMINGENPEHFGAIGLAGRHLKQLGFSYNGATYNLERGRVTISIDLKRKEWIVIDDDQGGQIILHRNLNFLHEVQNLVRELTGCEPAIDL